MTAFLEPIRSALTYLGDAHLQYRDHPPLDAVEATTLNAGEGLRVPCRGHHSPYATIEIALHYFVIHCPDDLVRGPYRCRSAGYIMSINDAQQSEMIAFHWHPIQISSPERSPHLHIGERRIAQLDRLHIPTPRISVEQFITLAIDSLGLQPKVPDAEWRTQLTASHERHATYRSWENHADAPFTDGMLK